MTNEQREGLEPTVKRLQHLLATLHRQFPEAWKQFDMFRSAKAKTIPGWPDWCFCPMTFSCAIVAEGGGDPIDQFGLAGILAAAAAWRVGQGIYVFDETVLQDLWGQPINGEIPSEVLLRLPESGIYVAFPAPMIVHEGAEPRTVFGFFAHLDYDSETQTRTLRIAADSPDGFMQTVPIDLVGTLDDSIKSVMAEAVRQISGGAAAPDGVDDLVAGVTAENSEIAQQARAVREPFLSVCLYLCADNAEIEGMGSRRRPVLVKDKKRATHDDAQRSDFLGSRLSHWRGASQGTGRGGYRVRGKRRQPCRPAAAYPQSPLAPLLDRPESQTGCRAADRTHACAEVDSAAEDQRRRRPHRNSDNPRSPVMNSWWLPGHSMRNG